MRVQWLPLALSVAAGWLVAQVASADGSWSTSGSIAVEGRWFVDSPAFVGQLDGEQLSLVAAPEVRWRSEDRRHQVDVVLFGRLDDADDERTHADVREASYRYVGDRVELVAGISRVFWGVTESRHLVDVVNTIDAVEDIDEEDKLGQPMLLLAIDRSWGRLELLILPEFRERPFPGIDGRLRPPLPVDDTARFTSGAEVDWALRWSQVLGDWDVGVHAFRGTGRSPGLVPAADGRSLIPVYDRVDQIGVDLQYTRDAWLFKLEALARDGQGARFGAAVGGFEYTVFQVAGSSADLGLLVEWLWDERDVSAPPTIFDRDTFLGARLALNDIQNTQLLVGAIVDQHDGSTLAVVEASRRLGERTTLEIEARLFHDVAVASDLAAFARDGFVNLRAAWHW